MQYGVLTLLLLLAVALLAGAALRPPWLRGHGGRILALLAFFVLPSAISVLGLSRHLEQSKSTEFCLSCHVMEDYGQSLRVDDPEVVAAQHYQNRLIPREQACFTCHTTYTMYGDLRAKLQGARHLWVHYLGEPPEKLELYAPYNNRECLSCHAGARSFEEDELHAEIRAELASGETSCLECHGPAHGVEDLGEAELWSGEAGS